MPYVRLNPAKFGNSAATEESSRGRASIAVTGITVRPLAPLSRSTFVTDTTLYEVNVRFNLQAEGVNVDKAAGQTLEFAVGYIGAVETVTELLDPVAELTYSWEVSGGTDSSVPPFAMTRGKEMALRMVQTGKYTDPYGNTATGSPVAAIKFTAANDTVWVSSPDELKTLADRTGEIAPGQSAVQTFGSDIQELTAEWSYESSEALIAGETVAMPFYSLSPVSLREVTVSELDEGTRSGKECAFYRVNATFTQKATPNNLTSPAEPVEIEYAVSYIGAMELKPVKVEYVRSGYWRDPHDNMALAYCAFVDRYITYNNGKRVSDRFGDYGHITGFPLGGSHVEGYNDLDVGWADGGPITFTEIGDSIGILSQSIKLWQVGTYSYPKGTDEYILGGLGEWDRYRPSNDYRDDSFNLCKDVYCPQDWPEDSRPSGWYYLNFRYRYGVAVLPDNGQEYPWALGGLEVGFDFYDQFLVVDGRRIDFADMRKLKMDFNLSEQNFSEPGKEGKIAKLEMRASLFDKNFYCAHIDTLYVER